MRRLLVTVAALALTLTGCVGTTIDHKRAEKLLVGKAPTGGATVTSAHCPSGVDAKARSTFDCDVKLSDGTSGTWTLHIANNKGEVFAGPTDFGQNPAKSPGSEVGKTKLATASGGVRLKATLVAFRPNVIEPSPDASRHISGVQLRIQNVGRSTYNDASPGDLSVLLLPSTAGTNVAPDERGPCGGSFYRTRLRLAPGASAQGCIPFEVPSGLTGASFKFTPKGERGVSWFVR